MAIAPAATIITTTPKAIGTIGSCTKLAVCTCGIDVVVVLIEVVEATASIVDTLATPAWMTAPLGLDALLARTAESITVHCAPIGVSFNGIKTVTFTANAPYGLMVP